MPLEIIILAAGKGTRMRSALPKVLHNIANKPLLQHVLDTAEQLSPNKIHVVVGHGSDQVKTSCNSKNINWVLQKEQLGTGHAVQQAMSAVSDKSNVLVLYGDVPLIQKKTLEQLNNAAEHHELALLTAIMQDPTGYGRITRDNSNQVNGIVEQKDASQEQLDIDEINTGFLCAPAKKLNEWLTKIDNNNAQQEYYLTDIVELAYKNGSPIATLHPKNNSETIGINSRSELATVERLYQTLQAERLMTLGVTIIDPQRIDIRGDVTFGQDCVIDINAVIEGPCTLGDNVHIEPNCVIKQAALGNNVTIHSHSVVEQAQIGDNAHIGPFARLRPGSNLESDVRIGNFVEVKNTVMAKGAKANHLSYVGDATVGQNTNIGAGVITCNYDGANKHKTEIGENAFIGSDSQLVAPVKIGDNATVGAGATITTDVPADQLAISRAKQRHVDGWKRPKKKK